MKTFLPFLFAAALLLASCKGPKAGPADLSPAPGAAPAKAESPAGNPAAPLLKVELYVPLGPDCHRKTLDLVKKYAEEHPGRVETAILPMGNPKKDKEMHARGITCATVLVDGKSEFDLPDGKGGARRVVFSHKPNEPDSTYRSEDVIAAIEAVLKNKARDGGE